MPELVQILVLDLLGADGETVRRRALRHRARRILLPVDCKLEFAASAVIHRLLDLDDATIIEALGPGPNLLLLPGTRRAAFIDFAGEQGLACLALED